MAHRRTTTAAAVSASAAAPVDPTATSVASSLIVNLSEKEFHTAGPDQTWRTIEVGDEPLQVKFCYSRKSEINRGDGLATYAKGMTDGTCYLLYPIRVVECGTAEPLVNAYDLIKALGYSTDSTQHSNFVRDMRTAYTATIKSKSVESIKWFRGAYTFPHSCPLTRHGPGITIRGCALIFNQSKVSKVASQERCAEIRRELATVMGLDESLFFLSSETDIIRLPQVATNIKEHIQKLTPCFPSYLEFVVSPEIRVDIYFPAGIVVEIDEHGHSGYGKAKETAREQFIIENAHSVYHRGRPGRTAILRFNPDQEGADLASFCGRLISALHQQAIQVVKDDLAYERDIRKGLEASLDMPRPSSAASSSTSSSSRDRHSLLRSNESTITALSAVVVTTTSESDSPPVVVGDLDAIGTGIRSLSATGSPAAAAAADAAASSDDLIGSLSPPLVARSSAPLGRSPPPQPARSRITGFETKSRGGHSRPRGGKQT